MSKTTNDRRPQHQTAGSDNDPSAQEDGIVETVVSAVKGDDEPMEESHPRTTLAMVFFSYPMLLIGLVIVVAVSIWLFGGFFGGGEATQ